MISFRKIAADLPRTGIKNRAISLRSRLLGIIGISLVVLWSAVAIWMVLDVRGELRVTLDERLAASARMVAGLMSQLPALPTQGGAANAVPLVIGRDGLACEVSVIRGEVAQTVAGTAGSPGLSGAALGYDTREIGGKLWRTYVLRQGEIRIATADRVDVREKLLRDVALTAGIPFAIALLGSFLLLWFGIGRGLAPIERVRAVLAARQPADSAPLPETYPPVELRPLVDTIRNLLQRVHTVITFERQFTDDAAHELRTPLTAVKTHLQVARLASTTTTGTDIMLQALANADQGVIRLQRTLDQLLLLARLDSGVEQENSYQTDALHAARQAIADAQAGRPDSYRIELEALSISGTVMLQETMLISALRNLLDNALRYAPPGTSVTLRIEPNGANAVRFSVMDRGPGLDEEACAHATQRFWRRGIASPGSGLGLSIVSAIARSSGGDLSLHSGIDGGLIAQITLPTKNA
jgi:two-component system sensor histidine kinase QseC